jgi:hypothetical protein
MTYCGSSYFKATICLTSPAVNNRSFSELSRDIRGCYKFSILQNILQLDTQWIIDTNLIMRVVVDISQRKKFSHKEILCLKNTLCSNYGAANVSVSRLLSWIYPENFRRAYGDTAASYNKEPMVFIKPKLCNILSDIIELVSSLQSWQYNMI